MWSRLALSGRRFGTLAGLAGLCVLLWILTPHFLTVSNLLNVAGADVDQRDHRGRHDVRDHLGRHRSLGGIAGRGGRCRAGERCCSADSRAARDRRGARRRAWRSAGERRRASRWGRLPPFIATLGMMSVARGCALLFTDGRPISGSSRRFAALATGRSLGVPAPVVVDAVVYLVAHFVLHAHAVRPLRLRDRRQRGGDAALRRQRAAPQDDGLRRRRAVAARSRRCCSPRG